MLDVRPLTTALGAEIHGVDCAAPLDDETIASIRKVWLERLVVFFPNQHLDADQQIAFAARFGEVTEGHPVEPLIAERPELQPIDSVKDRTNFWHTDVTFMAEPPMASMLYSVVVPDVGGDTMWANLYMAYEALSPAMQELLASVDQGGVVAVWDLIEYASARVTLKPGDVISTGTPYGVGGFRKIFLRDGDRLRVEIEGVGVLDNVVRAG